ncbi:MAG: hypothetical protein KUG79_12405 [Pseudomonadales bacterium]|nr:hypothetical protein [Pseudomonadales bacterium]
MNWYILNAWLLLVPLVVFLPATALAIDLAGSLAEDKNFRYIPAISNPLFNETPLMTTEIRPILLLNKIPDDFVTEGGDRLPFDFEGIDLVNFGSTDAGTVTTAAIGARFIITDHVRMGIAFETPIGSDEDIMDRRFYLDLVLSI